jgi:pectin methylesterase-like acyl-CoA thioesterase
MMAWRVHIYTVQNTAPVPRPGALGKQGVALRISADNAAFVGCNFLGTQDTLYDHLGRHYYRDYYIEGCVDFIFGNALSLYEVATVFPQSDEPDSTWRSFLPRLGTVNP